MSPLLPGKAYARAVSQDREIADVIAVNEAHGCLDDADRDAFAADRARAWRDSVRAACLPQASPPKRDTSAWYVRQIEATERRIERNERAIRRWESRPRPDTSDARAAINAPLKQRQRGMAGEMKAWRTYDTACTDLPAARARLAWLQERNPS